MDRLSDDRKRKRAVVICTLETLVVVNNNQKEIGRMKKGDFILSWSEEGRIEIHADHIRKFHRYFDHVVDLHMGKVNTIFCLTFKNQLSQTDSFLFLTENALLLVDRRKKKRNYEVEKKLLKNSYPLPEETGIENTNETTFLIESKFGKWTSIADLRPGVRVFIANGIYIEIADIESTLYRSEGKEAVGLTLKKGESYFVGEHGILVRGHERQILI